jgi:hypothetical protein
MRSTGDCSKNISREHYVSRGLINRPGLKIRGLPWQTDLVQHASADALTSKILCLRHNNALSPLDQEAQRAFLAIETAQSHATKVSLARKRFSAILSGDALELWALKTIIGLQATGMHFPAGSLSLQDFPVPLVKIAEALNTGQAAGLVRLEIPQMAEAHEPSIGRSAVTTLMVVDEEAGRMTAVLIRLQGLGLMFHLADEEGAFDCAADLRPHAVDLIGPHRSSRLYFGWPNPAPGRVVSLRIRPPTPRERRIPSANAGSSS